MAAVISALPGIASAIGGVAGMFGGRRNPSREAGRYLDQIPGMMQPYYQPYINAGQGALGKLQGEYGTALDDPNAIYNKLGQGYKESPGYKARLQKALGAAGNSAAAGGMLGSPQDQQQQAQMANDITAQDYENYFNHMQGIYNTGLAGEGDINRQGFDASTGYGNILGQVQGQKANMAYNDAASQNQANAQNWANIFGGIGAAGQGYNSYNQQQDLLNWWKNNGGR